MEPAKNETPANDPRRQISPERKKLYYGGMILSGVGFLLFLSTFFIFMLNIGDFTNFASQMRWEMCLSLSGIMFIIGGGVLMNIGLKGWSGSGIILDPEQARKDVEPLARMGGGVTQDALSEIEVVKKLDKRLEDPGSPQVKVRCRNCQALNDEDAKFCKQCGSAL
jgi:RNA polymerase subunit RPABC4/transcription elongation factor Spt4